MNQMNIDLTQISEESIYAGVINKRDQQIILLSQQVVELQKENEKLKVENEQLKQQINKENK